MDYSGHIRKAGTLSIVFVLVVAFGCAFQPQAHSVSDQLRTWQRITIDFKGPDSSETSLPNPFTDYRLNVTFTNGTASYTVPGFYAGDGNAAQTSAEDGNKWRVHFTPDRPGKWNYKASFRTGKNIAVDLDPNAGSPAAFDGKGGSFTVSPAEKNAPGFYSKGILRYNGSRYLQFAGSGEYFLKGGADSPENFLAYEDFDGTFDTEKLEREGEAKGDIFIHTYAPHAKDFRDGDPTWKNGKGKNIIGALNYLASKRINSVYFLTYNLDGGDGKDVWPWTDPKERYRFDCSKLDQWEIVFSHMDSLGLMLHIVTQETENDHGLDGGDLGLQRKLYYRELIARFAHHLAITWNLGEENKNSDSQRKAFAKYIRDLDPYDHLIVIHTWPGHYDKVYPSLLGFEALDGASLQMNADGSDTHSETLKWIKKSKAAGRNWVVCLDEYGHGKGGVATDDIDYWHDEARKNCLWGNLMAGGGGSEWYFGYPYPHNDLNCEDWRSRDHMWELTQYALDFFHRHLPFTQMYNHNELTAAKQDYCFATPGSIYAVYLPNGGTTEIDLQGYSRTFTVKWYDPRNGGSLKSGSIKKITGPGKVSLGLSPYKQDMDWVILIK